MGSRAPDLRRARRAHALAHRALAAAVDVLDVRLPRAVRAAVGAGRTADELEFETATVTGRERRHRAHRPRRAARAADRRRARLAARALQRARRSSRPNARLSRGLEVHPAGRRRGDGAVDRPALHPRRLRLELSRRATSCASASARSGPPTTSRSRPCASPRDLGLPPDGYQGNWIPHQLRPAVEDGVFFVGDSAGHCLPLTAEGIRTALYFGLACGRELRAVLDGRSTREQALAPLRRLLGRARAQVPLAAERPARRRADHAEPRDHARSCAPSRAAGSARWAFEHYLAIAPPSFVGESAVSGPRPGRVAVAAAR